MLAVVCIDNLKQGIELVNQSDYGLTSGLQSLDEKEQALWTEHIEAGNLYINRGITGAIVRRQPFGGMKRSAFGGGLKAGGPNYVSSFVEFTEKAEITPSHTVSNYAPYVQDEADKTRLNYAAGSYRKWWDNEFSQSRDVCQLYGESNHFRYRPLKQVGFRVTPSDSLADVLLVISACKTTPTPLFVSLEPGDGKAEVLHRLIDVDVVEEGLYQFTERYPTFERIRVCSTQVPDDLFVIAAEYGKHVASDKPTVEGRIELLHYLKEQSITNEYHRYGSIFGEEK